MRILEEGQGWKASMVRMGYGHHQVDQIACFVEGGQCKFVESRLV